MITDLLLIDLLTRAVLISAVALGVCCLLPVHWRVSWLRLAILSLLALPAIRWGLPAVPLPLLPAAGPVVPAAASLPSAGGLWPAYFTIAVLVLAWSLAGLLRLRRRAAKAAPARLEVPHEVDVRWCTQTPSPLSFGWLRPVILLPAHWARDSQAPRIRHCLAHELAHIDSADWPWLWLQKICQSLYWALPPLWWLNRQLSQATEIAADRRALGRVDCAAAYARTLLEINAQASRRADSIKTPAVALFMAGLRPWRTRIEACLQADEENLKMSRWKLPASAMLALALLLPLAACQITRASEPPPMPDPAPAADQVQSPLVSTAGVPVVPAPRPARAPDPAHAPAVPGPSALPRQAPAPEASPEAPSAPRSDRPAPEIAEHIRAQPARLSEQRAAIRRQRSVVEKNQRLLAASEQTLASQDARAEQAHRKLALLHERVASLEAELARTRERLQQEQTPGN